MKDKRNHLMDFVRLVLATLVIVAHAPELTDGNKSREILCRLTHSNVTFGALAVDGFFLLSGYLIARSWEYDPNFWNFLRKRVLRIVPGYLVAALLSVVVVGYLAPATPHFFAELDRRTLFSIMSLDKPSTPPVLPGMRYEDVNGSMWTIVYEFRSYILVGLLGLSGILRRRSLLLLLTLSMFMCFTSAGLSHRLMWKENILLGNAEAGYRLYSIYLLGVCFYAFRDKLQFRMLFAQIAVLTIAAAAIFLPGHFENVLVIAGSYLLFFTLQTESEAVSFMRQLPDISYGVYLYAWPIEALWIYYMRGNPWLACLVTTIIAYGLGWLSWHFVERPALSLKRRSSTVLSHS